MFHSEIPNLRYARGSFTPVGSSHLAAGDVRLLPDRQRRLSDVKFPQMRNPHGCPIPDRCEVPNPLYACVNFTPVATSHLSVGDVATPGATSGAVDEEPDVADGQV